MNKTNLKIARFIAEDEGGTEILLPKFGWFNTEEKRDIDCRPFSEAAFDKDWNYLMLAGRKVLEALNKLEHYNEANLRLIESRINRLMTCIGTCEIDVAYNTIVEEINELTK